MLTEEVRWTIRSGTSLFKFSDIKAISDVSSYNIIPTQKVKNQKKIMRWSVDSKFFLSINLIVFPLNSVAPNVSSRIEKAFIFAVR